MISTSIESTFNGARGIKLFRRSWLPASPTPGRTIALVHGYAEHSGRYEWVGQQLSAAGYSVYAYDLRGHGRSEGERVRVRSFSQHLNDLAAFLRIVQAESGDEAPFLLGHSMGGGIGALYAATRAPQLRGLILSGPLVYQKGGVPLRILAKVIGLVARVRPGLGLMGLKAATVSRDAAVVAAYDTDPLVYRGKLPAISLVAMARAIAHIQERMEAITVPLLLLHGTADELCDPEGSRQLYATVSSTDKTLKLYEGLAHEVLNEPEKETVLADLRAWLEARS